MIKPTNKRLNTKSQLTKIFYERTLKKRGKKYLASTKCRQLQSVFLGFVQLSITAFTKLKKKNAFLSELEHWDFT